MKKKRESASVEMGNLAKELMQGMIRRSVVSHNEILKMLDCLVRNIVTPWWWIGALGSPEVLFSD